MHLHDVEFQIRNLSVAGNYKRSEKILWNLRITPGFSCLMITFQILF